MQFTIGWLQLGRTYFILLFFYSRERHLRKSPGDAAKSRQFTDKTVHRDAFWRQYIDIIEDSSPTELKTVHRQILYFMYMECHNLHYLLML